MLTGFFATETVTGEGSGVRGIFYGDDGMQLVRQLYGIGVSIVWSSLVTLLLLKVSLLFLSLRARNLLSLIQL